MSMRMKKGTSGRTRVLFVGEILAPVASKYTTILDTMRLLPCENNASPPRSNALPSVPAEDNVIGFRGQALGRLYGFMVSCVGQNVTLLQHFLHGDGTLHQLDSTVITAGAAAQRFVLDPSMYGATDAVVTVLAGATAPDNVYVSLTERTLP